MVALTSAAAQHFQVALSDRQLHVCLGHTQLSLPTPATERSQNSWVFLILSSKDTGDGGESVVVRLQQARGGRKETDRLCSNTMTDTGGGDSKAER
jgi:hypothetical protein